MIDIETVRATAIIVWIAIANHVTSTIGGDLWRDRITAVAFLRILKTSERIIGGMAGIQANLDRHGGRSTGGTHCDRENAGCDRVDVASL